MVKEANGRTITAAIFNAIDINEKVFAYPSDRKRLAISYHKTKRTKVLYLTLFSVLTFIGYLVYRIGNTQGKSKRLVMFDIDLSLSFEASTSPVKERNDAR